MAQRKIAPHHFKAKVALEHCGRKRHEPDCCGVRGHATQISQWKKQALDSLRPSFPVGAGSCSAVDEGPSKISCLHRSVSSKLRSTGFKKKSARVGRCKNVHAWSAITLFEYCAAVVSCLSLNRSSFIMKTVARASIIIGLMTMIDEQFTEERRRFTAADGWQKSFRAHWGSGLTAKELSRLMKTMGIAAIFRVQIRALLIQA